MNPSNRVTSTRSDRVTAVRALHARQGRRKAGLFVVEGPQAVRSALNAGVPIRDLIVGEDAAGVFADVIAQADSRGITVTWATPPVLAAMAETNQPQGLIAVCPLLPEGSIDVVMAADGPVLLLDGVSDPGNVGTIIRTADAAGAAGVALTPGSADVHSGKVVRSTAGSLFHLPVLSGVDAADVAASARRHGRTVVVATGDGPTDLFAAVDSGLLGPRTCWIIGSEAHGVSAEAREVADEAVSIPMLGRAESLNAAVAAAVVLFVTAHAARENGDSDPDARG